MVFHILRQAMRGCGTLPFVGEHPGTGFVVMLILTGGAAGWKGGLLGVSVGAGMMALVMGAIYLCGAYSRAQLSDRLDAQAIEARRAETQSGSVHESAVAESHAPEAAPNTNGDNP